MLVWVEMDFVVQCLGCRGGVVGGGVGGGGVGGGGGESIKSIEFLLT